MKIMAYVTIPNGWVIKTRKDDLLPSIIAQKVINAQETIARSLLENLPVPYTEKKSPTIVFPTIVDVKVGKERLSKEEKQRIDEKDRKNVYTIVMFDDGTVEKATTADGDEYNLEQGIQICLAKKAFSLINGNGSNTFNDLVNSAVKLYNNKEKEKDRDKECEEQAKVAAKAKADKIEREKAKKREKRINEMAEAYARAMRMVSEDNNNV